MTSTLAEVFIPPETRAGRLRRIRKRIGLGTATAMLIATALWAGITKPFPCGSLGSGVYRVDGECVGVTDGSYLFNPEFDEVQQKIADENARVRAEASSYVTVALLDYLTPTATSAKAAENVRSALEGAYTAQRRINESVLPPSSSPQIQLVLTNHGSVESQSQRVVDQLAKMTQNDDTLVAVIGMGVSTAQTRERAEALSSHNIPMVGALMTADELDHNHIPGLIRVSPTTMDYARALRQYTDTRTDIGSAVLVYDTNSDTGEDLFTGSLKKDLEQQMQHLTNGRPPLTFVGASIPTEAGPGRFDRVTPNICAPPTDAVLYAGRKVDLIGFLDSLAKRQCRNTPLTVITAADIGFILREQEQKLRNANLTVVYAGTSDAEGWKRGIEGTPQGYNDFLAAFLKYGFDEQGLADSEGIMMHDALLTAEQAVLLASPNTSRPTAAKVRSVLLNLHGVDQVQGASGTLSFISRETGAGNPVGKPVPVLKFPSPPGDPSGQQVLLYITQ